MPDYSQLLNAAVFASVAAGREILGVYSESLEIQLKDDRSPLTLADRKSHEKIMQLLNNSTLPVLSEEGRSIPYEERKSWKMFWMVDPLDGTKEFIKRNGEFTVNIALVENNHPVMGIIYVPASDTLYYGANWLPGRVAYHVTEHFKTNSTPEQFTTTILGTSLLLPVSAPARNYTVVASRSHSSPETELFIDGIRKQHPKIDFVSSGSSIKICLVAEGSADVYPRLAPTMEWDTAAGQAIAESCGCTMNNYHTGETVTYNKENLLNPHFVVKRP